MMWVRYIVNTVKPDFGGIATFCENPDGILDMPEVREALRAEGMTVIDWDGSSDALLPLRELKDNDMPVVVVPDGPHRHIAQGILPSYVWHNISIGSLFSKFNVEVVRSVPRVHWDELKALHQGTRTPQNLDETAILIARAVYGADPLHLEIGDGWLKLLVQVAESNEGLPLPISQVLTRNAPEWLGGSGAADLFADPAAAKGGLAVLKNTQQGMLEQTSTSTRAKIESITTVEERPKRKPTPKLVKAEIDLSESAEGVLESGLAYCQQVAKGKLDEPARLAINEQFGAWLEKNYALVLSSHNPKVLRVSNLVEKLDMETEDDRLLTLVVDGMGLVAWNAVEEQWRQDGIVSRADTRAAFAIIPTITSLSRRAIFEGKPPSQFGDGDHTTKLERSLWLKRFGSKGAYFSSGETLGILDSFALGKQRIVVVDTDWDKLAHALDPKYGSIVEAAANWAAKTELRNTISEAHKTGYRVVVIADHGEVECRGVGRPKSGELTDERSKRVLLFPNSTLRASFLSNCYNGYQPPGLPAACCPLFSRGFDSFDQADVRCYSHGGLSIEEVLVPVAEVFNR